MHDYVTANEAKEMLSYKPEIRMFLMRARPEIDNCIRDILESSNEVDENLRISVQWYTLIKSVFIFDGRQQVSGWQFGRTMMRKSKSRVYDKLSVVPEELRLKVWRDIELPTSMEQMNSFLIGKMFIALQEQLEKDGYFVSFDFSKDHSPKIIVEI